MYTFAKMCFLCLNNKNKCSLINYKDCDLNSISAYDKLKQIIPELISETIYKVPTWICVTCKAELDSSYIFYQKCQKSLQLLQTYNEKLKSVNNPAISPKDTYLLNINIPPLKSPSNETASQSIAVKDEIQEDTFLFDQLVGRKSPNDNEINPVKEETDILKVGETVEDTSKIVSSDKLEENKDSSNAVREESSEKVKEEPSVFDEDTFICEEGNSSSSNISIVKNELNPELFNENEEKSYFGMFRNKSALESAFPTKPDDDKSALTSTNNNETISDNQVALQEIINKTISTALNEEENENRNKRRCIRPVCYNYNEESEEEREFTDSDFDPESKANLDAIVSDGSLSYSSTSNQSSKRVKLNTSYTLNDVEKGNEIIFSYFHDKINNILQNKEIQDLSNETIVNTNKENVREIEAKTPEPAVVIHHLPQKEYISSESTLVAKENISTSVYEAQLNLSTNLPIRENTSLKEPQLNLAKENILPLTGYTTSSSSKNLNLLENSNEANTDTTSNLNKPIKNSFRRKYVCNICRNKFKSSNELQEHVSSHVIKEHKCKTCFELCLNEKDLELHMKEHNPPEYPTNNELLPSGKKPPEYSTNNELLPNERKPPEYPTNNELLLSERKPPEHPTINELLPGGRKPPLVIKLKQLIPTTSITTSDKNVLYYPPVYPEVIEIKSEGESSDSDYFMEKFFCNICNKKCKDFAEHMKIHQDENKAICVYCNTTFPIKNQLFQHLRDVHCASEPICQICNEKFENIELLFLHMYSHYGTEVHKCPECHQLFLHAVLLYRHLETVHNCNEFSCLKCDKTADSSRLISQHYVHHESKSSTLCYVCGKCLKTKRQMRAHMHNYHDGPRKNYTCQVCGKQCSTQENLRRHMAVRHMNEMYKCDVCEKTLNSRVAFNLHRTSHLEEKKRFACKECGKKFRLKFLLKNHERVHTGEKPFECKTCGKKFTQEISLVVHNRIHTGEKPYTCTDCDKSYTQSYVYKMHLKKHHSNSNSNSKENKSEKLPDEKET